MFITIVLIPILRLLAFRMNILDVPDSRKAHVTPIPKSGGIAVVLGAILPVLFWAPIDNQVWAILIGVGILFVFGLLDDVKNLNYKIKLAAQLAAALVVILYGGINIKSLGMLMPDNFLLPDLVAHFVRRAAVGRDRAGRSGRSRHRSGRAGHPAARGPAVHLLE